MREIFITKTLSQRRAAVKEDGRIVEIMIEHLQKKRLVGSIFKGKVTDVLPGMNAAFVDIGQEKNGYLHAGDTLSSPTSILDAVKTGDERIVQVVKDSAGHKGVRLSELISLAGKFIVYMPNGGYVGVSKKIPEDRKSLLRQIGSDLIVPPEGLIIRTDGNETNPLEWQQELEQLRALWSDIVDESETAAAPTLLYEEGSLLERLIRNFSPRGLSRIVVDSEEDHTFLTRTYPRSVPIIIEESTDLFAKEGIEKELNKALKQYVWLKNGACLIIEKTEALTVIDVNTGRYTGTDNVYDTIKQTNLEAAVEIARQLRLRDLSGLILIDFIAMATEQDRLDVVACLKEALKKDRATTNVIGMTATGMVEMTRKKVQRSLEEQLTVPCRCCDGTGRVLSPEALALKAEQLLFSLRHCQEEAVLLELSQEAGERLAGENGQHLHALEDVLGFRIILHETAMNHVKIVKTGRLDDVLKCKRELSKYRPV